jgi:hypothetical protein
MEYRLNRTFDDVLERLDFLKTTEAGWDGYDAKSTDSQLIEGLKDFLKVLVEESQVPVPYLYPTEEGGVRTEWHLDLWEAILTFENEKVDFIAFDKTPGSEEFIETEYDFSESSVPYISQSLRDIRDTTSHKK